MKTTRVRWPRLRLEEAVTDGRLRWVLVTWVLVADGSGTLGKCDNGKVPLPSVTVFCHCFLELVLPHHTNDSGKNESAVPEWFLVTSWFVFTSLMAFIDRLRMKKRAAREARRASGVISLRQNERQFLASS